MHYEKSYTITLKHIQYFHQMLTLERWRMGILGFGVIGAALTWMFINWTAPETQLTGKAATCAIFAVELMLVITLTIVLANRATIKGQVRRSGKVNYVQTVRIDGFGVHADVAGKKERYDFEKLQKVKETTRAFYIFVRANQALILPKDQMEDPEAEGKLLQELFQPVMASSQLKFLKK